MIAAFVGCPMRDIRDHVKLLVRKDTVIPLEIIVANGREPTKPTAKHVRHILRIPRSSTCACRIVSTATAAQYRSKLRVLNNINVLLRVLKVAIFAVASSLSILTPKT